MAEYVALTDEKLLLGEFEKLIELESTGDARWNKNRYAYISNLLLLSYRKSKDKRQFIKLALEYPTSNRASISVANRRKLTTPLIGDNYQGAEQASSTLKTLIGLVESHLSSKKILKFHTRYQQNFGRNKFITKSLIFQSLPELPKCLLAMSTSTLVDELSANLPPLWLASYKKNIDTLDTYKNKAAAIATYRRLVFSLGLARFIELSDRAVFEFRQIDENMSIRCYGLAVGFLRELGARDLTLDGVAASIDARKKVQKSKLQKKDATLSECHRERINNDSYYCLSAGQAHYYSGLKEIIISVKRTNNNTKISIGGYEFNDVWSSYKIENIANSNSPWVRSQREYINSFCEKSTKKSVSSALQYLNVYLFHYLVYFFKKHTVPYPYPHKISDFKNAVFVSPSDIITEHIYQATDVAFPISIINWIKITGESHKDAVVKARVNRIYDYFDFIVLKYRGIEGYELYKNPFLYNDLRSIKGSAYQRSNKKLLELEYWVLFAEFLKVLASTLIENIEKGIFIPKTGDYELRVNKYVQFGEYKVHIGNIRNLGLSRCVVHGKSYLQPQYVLAFLVMAKSGLRLSSVMNLDLRTYDQYVDSHNTYKPDDLVDIEVNTDKSKTSYFRSQLTFSAFNLLKRFISIRNEIHGVPLTPKYYKGEVSSKWGRVLPILATSSKGGYEIAYKFLRKLLHSFEQEMQRASIQLNSETFYKPMFHSSRVHESFRRLRQTTPVDKYCIHYTDGESAYFTPIEIGSGVTPHSFRKTVDTYYSILVGDKATGVFFTGQTEATVGYYREVTPENWNKVMAHTGRFPIPNVVPVERVYKDETEIRQKLIKDGLNGVQGFTLSALDTEVRLDLSKINPSDIAINRTHICVYGNTCPPEILACLDGKKNCAICPVSIGTPSDGVAIAAQIKYHVDNIAEINELLTDDNLLNTERQSLVARRTDELNSACSWFVRHKFVLSESRRMGEYVVLDDGTDRVKAKLEYIHPQSEAEGFYARLREVKSIPSLQSNNLKKKASRLSRKLLKRMHAGELELPDIKPVEVALALIKKVADVHDLQESELSTLVQESIQDKTLSIDEFLKLEGLYDG